MVSSTEWRAFMCHNLGATITLNPYTPAPGLVGTRYNAYRNWYVNGKKNTALDPCPENYRIPTVNEWQGVIDNNVISTAPDSKAGDGNGGYFLGPNLMLPYAYRGTNAISYWAGNQKLPSYPNAFTLVSSGISNTLFLGYNTYPYTNDVYTTTPSPIRCIAIPDNEK